MVHRFRGGKPVENGGGAKPCPDVAVVDVVRILDLAPLLDLVKYLQPAHWRIGERDDEISCFLGHQKKKERKNKYHGRHGQQ